MLLCGLSQVCSTHNVTFDSECELHRIRCLCHKADDECPDDRYKHARMDYFGACKGQKQNKLMFIFVWFEDTVLKEFVFLPS